MGLYHAGLGVTGVSWTPEPEYPFRLVVEDALKLTPEFIKGFDFVWASPPCQAYTWSAKRWPLVKRNDVVAPTRDLLIASGVAFVIENVPVAPIRKDLILEGDMFGLHVIRRRAFEIHGFSVPQPAKVPRQGTVKDGYYCTVAGHGGNGRAALHLWQEAMDIHWMRDKHSLAEAVPPAYAAYIGAAFLAHRKV